LITTSLRCCIVGIASAPRFPGNSTPGADRDFASFGERPLLACQDQREVIGHSSIS
jgi:hypothetical protein